MELEHPHTPAGRKNRSDKNAGKVHWNTTGKKARGYRMDGHSALYCILKNNIQLNRSQIPVACHPRNIPSELSSMSQPDVEAYKCPEAANLSRPPGMLRRMSPPARQSFYLFWKIFRRISCPSSEIPSKGRSRLSCSKDPLPPTYPLTLATAVESFISRSSG